MDLINKLSVFILAAGLGERLRPITDFIPKPLIPVLGKPVLESIIERISNLGVNKMGINLHHKKEALERWINNSKFSGKIELFPENPVLGTGGALKNAGDFLKNDPFLVHNSDIISDIDLEKLISFHLSSGNLVTLAVHDYPEFNKLEIDEEGFLIRILHHPHPTPLPSREKESLKTFPSPGGMGLRGGGGNITGRHLAFTGIAVYHPKFLGFLPPGVSSVTDAWLKAIHEGFKIGALDVTGCFWSDIGTPASYAKTVIHELRKNGETVYIHPSVNWCKDVEMDGYVVIESESTLNKKASLRNCIILPGTNIETKEPADADSECFLTLFWGKGRENTPPKPTVDNAEMEARLFENCILGSGFKIDVDETSLFEFAEADKLLIGTGGSDRKYYRVRKHDHIVVLMQSHDEDPDFQRHIEYTHFFKKYSIPVPALISVNPDEKNAFFEDLGDLSLYSWLKCPRETEEIELMYEKILDILTLIHTIAIERLSECPLLQGRIFDYEYLRWETDYFVERFVEGTGNIKIRNTSALNDEFHRLAVKVDSFPKTITHRDFQSQNIMVTKGGIPRLLDFQGARIGPPAYDVVSILWDPYHRLDDEVRKRLLDYYIERTSLEKEFRDTLLPCRLQRHMQALGAYGFLSTAKGKKYFLKYIPEGLRLLKEDLSVAENAFPVLYDIVKDL